MRQPSFDNLEKVLAARARRSKLQVGSSPGRLQEVETLMREQDARLFANLVSERGGLPEPGVGRGRHFSKRVEPKSSETLRYLSVLRVVGSKV